MDSALLLRIAAAGATLGLVLGAAIKVALAFAMIGVFLVARFSG